MFKRNKNLSILFADVSGSTKLYDTLGDEQANAIIGQTLDDLMKITTNYGGTVIKTIGDEVMCTFPSAEVATNAATEMQETMEEANEEGEHPTPIHIKIGYHHGPAIEKSEDVFGDAVNIAARMASQAKPKQIITTSITAEELPQSLREDTRFVDYAYVKGKGELEIVEVIWEQDAVTHMAADMPAMVANTAEPARMRIVYQGNEFEISPERESLTLGRGAVCDIQVKEELASRQHVRIELRRDKIFVVDQSTNGSYVQQGNEAPHFLRREEVPISGSGQISLGREITSEANENIVTFEQTSGQE
ncbi:MAG: adenylate/guanylate cyclase domain-containing protein [Pseudomonadota bacterium]